MAANDSGEVIRGKCRITAIHSQKIFWEGDFELQPDTVIHLAEIKCFSSQKELYIIEYETDSGEKIRHHYLAGYPQFDYNLFKTVYLKEIFGDIIR
jgi:hypothetical protein